MTESKAVRVLLIVGHPRPGSFAAALACAFADGAREAGVDLAVVKVGELTFDPDVWEESPEQQPLETDLAEVQRLIVWADHLVLVYPTWWSLFPARLKGLLDRVLTPGVAFRYSPDGRHRPLLGGRTAELITTMDTPPWVYRWILRAPGTRAFQFGTLGFCGIRTVRSTIYGPVITSNDDLRRRWLANAHSLGRRLATGSETPRQLWATRARAWLAALRLQFYPMTWIAYSVGALAATDRLDSARYWGGLLALFLLEAATVFCNEICDFRTDSRNQLSGPFTGGSRVLVERRLLPAQLQTASWLALIGFGVVAAWLVATQHPGQVALAATLTAMAVLATGYTVPPLRLAYRTLGELDVSATHSIGVLLIGYLLQNGAWHNAAPWLISLPLFLSVMPAITLSGIPDRDADRAAGKQTLAVRFGNSAAAGLAAVFALAAGAIGLIYWLTPLGGGLFGPAVVLPFVHAVLLAGLLLRYRRRAGVAERIDGLMAAALSLILWFGLIPLTALI